MSEATIRVDQEYVESHADKYLSPLEMVMSNARESVMKNASLYEKVGAPLPYSEAAATLAADTAKAEFEAKEKEDPIRRVIDVLQNSATSGRDQKIIQKRVEMLEQQRKNWKNLIDSKRTQAKIQGNLDRFSVEGAVADAHQWNQAATFTDYKNGQTLVYFEALDSTWLKNEDLQQGEKADERVRPSDECLNKVLIGLGVLENGEKYTDLRMLPSSDNVKNGAPSYYSFADKAEGMQTNIPEIKATCFLKEARVSISVPATSLEKIINFPSSV